MKLTALFIATLCLVSFAFAQREKRYQTIRNHPNMPSKRFIQNQILKKQRIIGGTTATISQAPFQVFMFTQSPTDVQNGVGELCGGALISPDYVLTAAHCLGTDYQNGLSISVYYGDVTPSDRTTGTRVDASEFIINSQFNMNVGFANDIALIKLATPVVEQAGVVEFVNLATSDPPTGTTLQIQGYGQTFEGQNFTSDTVIQLKIGNVIVATANDCINYFNSITIPPSGQTLPPNFFQPSADLCLRDGTVSTCHGDSGGSAVYKVNANDARWTTVGLVSFGGNTCPGRFTGFTRVSQYYNWVLSNTDNAASTSAPNGSPSSSQPPSSSSSPTSAEPTFDFPTDPLDTFDPQTTLAPGVTTTRASGPTTRGPTTTRIFATTRGPGTTSGPVRDASTSSIVTYNLLVIVAVIIAAVL